MYKIILILVFSISTIHIQAFSSDKCDINLSNNESSSVNIKEIRKSIEAFSSYNVRSMQSGMKNFDWDIEDKDIKIVNVFINNLNKPVMEVAEKYMFFVLRFTDKYHEFDQNTPFYAPLKVNGDLYREMAIQTYLFQVQEELEDKGKDFIEALELVDSIQSQIDDILKVD